MDIRYRAPTPASASAPLNDPDGAFDRAFSLVAFIMNRHIIDHMLRCARQLVDGDFEALVLWGVLAHQNVAHLMPPGSLPAAMLNERGRLDADPRRIRPLLLRDLAAITGIPRETARRKLEKLAHLGFVERVGSGWAVSTQRVEPDLREFTRESIKRLLAVSDEVRAALKSVDRPVGQALQAGPTPGL